MPQHGARAEELPQRQGAKSLLPEILGNFSSSLHSRMYEAQKQEGVTVYGEEGKEAEAGRRIIVSLRPAWVTE